MHTQPKIRGIELLDKPKMVSAVGEGDGDILDL